MPEEQPNVDMFDDINEMMANTQISEANNSNASKINVIRNEDDEDDE